MLTATLDAFRTELVTRFDVGDVVTLQTGGSRMTVTYVGPVAQHAGERLVCEWFDEQGELRREIFTPDSVRHEPRSISAGAVAWGKSARVGRRV
jgi:uncharacterized protein YodC (DUF2158 family)